MINLDEIKSAQVIEDPEAAFLRISSTLEEAAKGQTGNPTGTTILRRTEAGHPVLGKIRATKTAPPAPTGDSLRTLVESRGIPWDEAYASRAVPYFASDERVDSDGDIVQQTWHFDEFQSNPVLAFSHEWWNPSIGAGIDWQVVNRKDGDEGYEGPALWLLALFATQETSERADSIFRLVKAGMMPSGSVGFYSGKVIDVTDKDERQALGLGRWGFILAENHLLEFSPTLIGANPGVTTLSAAAQKNAIGIDDVATYRELYRRSFAKGAGDKAAWEADDGRIVEAAKEAFPGAHVEPHPELDEPIVDPAKSYSPPPEPEGIDPAAGAKGIADLRAEIATVKATGEDTRALVEQIKLLLEDRKSSATGGDDSPGDGEDSAELSQLLRDMDAAAALMASS